MSTNMEKTPAAGAPVKAGSNGGAAAGTASAAGTPSAAGTVSAAGAAAANGVAGRSNGAAVTVNGKGGPGKKARKGPRIVGTVILVVVILAGVIYGAGWWIDSAAYVGTDDAAIDGRQVKLSSKMLGRIRTVTAAEGEKVRAGQVLITLDDADLRAQEGQALASLAYARSNLTVARVAMDRSAEDFERARNLFSAQATTKENLDHAQRGLEAATAQYNLAQAAVDTSTAQLGGIETQLSNVRISTPIDGTVEKITLNPGDLAQPGQAILSVNNLESVWVIANFEETKIGRIRPGAPVVVSVDAYPGRPFDGTVDMIRAGIVPSAFQIGDFTKTTQRVPVRISLHSLQEGDILLPGMSVEVKVRTAAQMPAFFRGLPPALRRYLPK